LAEWDNLFNFAASNKNIKIMAKKIKIGTKISHTLFGGGFYEGKVVSIECCPVGQKYGTPVDSVTMEQIKKGTHEYVLDIDNGHWCYGTQVKGIVEG
jgi:hypothetical protein